MNYNLPPTLKRTLDLVRKHGPCKARAIAEHTGETAQREGFYLSSLRGRGFVVSTETVDVRGLVNVWRVR